jgi:hypothetical protein
MLIAQTLEEYQSGEIVDERIRAAAEAHQVRLLGCVYSNEEADFLRRQVHMSALVLFGPGAVEVKRIQNIMG